MSNQPIIRTFNDALAAMEDGHLVHDLSEAQRGILEAIHNAVIDGARKAKGSLTLKLDYTLDDGVVEILADVKAALPKTRRARSVMWVTPEHNLCRNNPRQSEMFGEPGEPKAVRTA